MIDQTVTFADEMRSPRRLITALLLRIGQSVSLQFLILLAFALLIRFPAFGDWNFEIDDQFYYLVGQRMLRGDVLYVDIWDRKGPALYLLYAAIGAIWQGPLAYQLAATFFAALGGFGVNRLARLLVEPLPALMAGVAYCTLLNQFGGANGQSPVFYNPLVIAGALAIASRIELLQRGRIDATVISGMAATGIAIAFKQSVIIEAGFFGCTIAALMWRSPQSRATVFARLALLALIGCLPIFATLMWYQHAGYFGQAWQALVTSNLDRGYDGANARSWFLLVLCGRLALPIAFAIIGSLRLVRMEVGSSLDRWPPLHFAIAWAIAAFVAIAAFPAIFVHYALTLIAPLCVLSSAFFARERIGPIACALLVVVSLGLGGTFSHGSPLAAIRADNDLEAYVRTQAPEHRIFVWGVPSALYARIDSRPPSPLLFAPHYYELSESQATGHDPLHELRRVLAWHPEAVVGQDPPVMLDANHAAIEILQGYLDTCRQRRGFTLRDQLGPQVQWVYSRCTPARNTGASR